jgi:hypothetical protein
VHRRLILAYLIVGLAMLALAGAVTGNTTALAMGGSFGYLLAMIHGVSFFVRSRKRRAPAALERTGTLILAITLGALAAVALGTLILVSLTLKGHREVPPATIGSVSVWMVLVGVLCWRAWIVPSARRAAVLQLVAVLLALPSLIGSIADAQRVLALHGSAMARMNTGMFIGFAVVACSGPVLDKLFAIVGDKQPEVVPEAIVRA